ncbi:WhiB family transcriptional regulator [Streptomyces sp. INA 01156]
MDPRCRVRGRGPELFFPLIERESEPQVARARAVCHRCRVLLACRRWAVEQGRTSASGCDHRRAASRHPPGPVRRLRRPGGTNDGKTVRARRE